MLELMKDIRKVMVVCDPASACGGLLHTAAALLRETGAELFVLAVIYNPFGVMGLSFPRPSLRKDYEALMEKTRKDLQALIRSEHSPGSMMHQLIREGKPVDEILAAVHEYKIDLLIVPAQHQTRLESLLSGGYNKTLLRKMPCSVMFIKNEPSAVVDEEEEPGDEQEAAA